MRYAITLAFAALCGLLVACGGSGSPFDDSGGDDGNQRGRGSDKPLVVSGAVLENDGTTTNLAGIDLIILPDDRLARTDGAGRFDFGTVGTAPFDIRLVSAGSTILQSQGSNDDGPDDDEAETEDDFDDDRLRIVEVEDGGVIELRLRIEDGRIASMSCSRTSHDEREARVRMSRTADATDPNLEGKIVVESRDDRERFKVEAEHATPGTELELFVIDDNGAEENLGIRTVTAVGEAEWKLDSRDGAILPFAVASVEALEGFRVEVRERAGGTTILDGIVPALPPAADPASDPSGDGTRLRGRSRLSAQEAGLEGYVEVRSRPDRGRERFKIEAEHVAPGRRVEFFVEDAGQPGTFVSHGVIAADALGEAELELHTDEGQALPGGANRVTELIGLRVEVRDASDGNVLLSGAVPTPIAD